MQHYFDDSSLLRQVVGHRLTALSGPRALLVMAAHPVAFAGFFAHTGALDDPYAPPAAHRDGDGRGRLRHQGARRQADGARARHAPHGARRAARGRRAVPGRHALPRRRSRAAAVDPRRAGGVGDARLRQVRPLALARRAERAVARLPRRRPPLRAARARDAARHRRLRGLHGRHVRERRAVRHARRRASWRSTSSCTRRCRCRQPLRRAGQPDHDRLAAGRPPPPVRLLAGTRCAPSRCAAAPSTSSASRPDCSLAGSESAERRWTGDVGEGVRERRSAPRPRAPAPRSTGDVGGRVDRGVDHAGTCRGWRRRTRSPRR